MIRLAKWIQPAKTFDKTVPLFQKQFKAAGGVRRAILQITAAGVYEAFLNGRRVGDFVLAPGWTSYDKRLQDQEYLERNNCPAGEFALVTQEMLTGDLAGRLSSLSEKGVQLLSKIRVLDC